MCVNREHPVRFDRADLGCSTGLVDDFVISGRPHGIGRVESVKTDIWVLEFHVVWVLSRSSNQNDSGGVEKGNDVHEKEKNQASEYSTRMLRLLADMASQKRIRFLCNMVNSKFQSVILNLICV